MRIDIYHHTVTEDKKEKKYEYREYDTAGVPKDMILSVITDHASRGWKVATAVGSLLIFYRRV